CHRPGSARPWARLRASGSARTCRAGCETPCAAWPDARRGGIRRPGSRSRSSRPEYNTVIPGHMDRGRGERTPGRSAGALAFAVDDLERAGLAEVDEVVLDRVGFG